MIVPQNPTYAYVGAFVDELARAGVRDVVICPGSRSTPLTLTFAAEERIRKWVLVDERSAAFFALGIAKQSGVPVALVCTSGTAAANFFPAICEAKASRIPLIVMTADRPPELQEVGAPQTMGQKYLYGEHVKWFNEMPLPEATNTLLRYARFTANRAVATAGTIPLGPIHLNFPLREPLSNTHIPTSKLPEPVERSTEAWQGRAQRYTKAAWDQHQFVDTYPFATRINTYNRGLIIVGPNLGAYMDCISQSELLKFANYWGFPVLADPLSLARTKYIDADLLIVDHYDAILRDPEFVKRHNPDLIIRFGAMPTSKPLLQYIQSSNCPIWLVDESNEWLDPTHLITDIIHMDGTEFMKQSFYETVSHTRTNQNKEWCESWRQATEVTQKILNTEINTFDTLFEGRIFTELASLLPDGSGLVVGNSMPIRDLDTFFPATTKFISLYGNRGVNGIDGQISTALGISACKSFVVEPMVLVVGDLTFYHDLNGLLAAKKYGLNLTIVVINNDGGGIFSFLPQAEHHPDHFEDYFGTPTGLDFSLVTAMYGGIFTRIENWDDFRGAVSRGITEGGLHVVEVPTNRDSNVAMHRHLWKKVSEALKELHSA
jgi:2-succinyl-5-enolpyruvyl-6-hydroxy-3-cyclohexene-1-carboxylate synthase